jgi:hypothetical protein
MAAKASCDEVPFSAAHAAVGRISDRRFLTSKRRKSILQDLACAGKTGEVSWMKEPDGEGLASHADSGSCSVVREDGGEALTGAHMGRVLSREILLNSGVPTLCKKAEGHIPLLAIARGTGTLRGLRPRARVDAPRTGTGRSRVRLGTGRGRVAKSQDARR